MTGPAPGAVTGPAPGAVGEEAGAAPQQQGPGAVGTNLAPGAGEVTGPAPGAVGEEAGAAPQQQGVGGAGASGSGEPGLILGPATGGAAAPASGAGTTRGTAAPAPGAGTAGGGAQTGQAPPWNQIGTSLGNLEASSQRTEALETEQLQTLENMSEGQERDRAEQEAMRAGKTASERDSNSASQALYNADLAIRDGAPMSAGSSPARSARSSLPRTRPAGRATRGGRRSWRGRSTSSRRQSRRPPTTISSWPGACCWRPMPCSRSSGHRPSR